jgi:hypothetical protein
MHDRLKSPTLHIWTVLACNTRFLRQNLGGAQFGANGLSGQNEENQPVKKLRLGFVTSARRNFRIG